MNSWISHQFDVLIVTMTSSVKLFQAAQQYMQVTGIYPPQSGQIHSFNAKNVFFLFCLFMVFVLVVTFFLFQAKTSVEFSISFYCSVTSLTAIGILTMKILKIPRNFKMLKSLEKFIETSELIQFDLLHNSTRLNYISYSQEYKVRSQHFHTAN